MQLETQTRIREISLGIKKIHEDLRSKYSILSHQNIMGFLIFSLSIAAIVCSFIMWWNSIIPSWACIVLIAFFTSFLHELEHDLIHELYFKKYPLIYQLMMFGVYVFRPLTLSPWYRKFWHHYHHQNSGTITDIEERGVSNGEKWSLLRLIIIPDLLLSFVLRYPRLSKEIKMAHQNGELKSEDFKQLKKTILFGMLPLGIPLYLMWYLYLGLSLIAYFGFDLYTAPMLTFCTPFVVGLIAPNLIRQFCLHFITSNMHYYGDIEKGNVIEQTQVLNAWWTIPFHLFCFNFGATHAIHHFVVNEPFYLRQLAAAKSHVIMRNYGVRFNDFGSFKRANRYH